MSPATEVKSRPIIMDAESVRAILDGRKTQTRRVWKEPEALPEGHEWHFHPTMDGRWELSAVHWSGRGDFHSYINCPYGSPGDLLWVRETWAVEPSLNHLPPRAMDPAGTRTRAGGLAATMPNYKADYPSWGPWPGTRWRSPIYMPKWAARLWLRVTDVRVERVQEICAPDALAEGCGVEPCARCDEQGCEDCAHEGWHSEVSRFRERWDDLNAKRGYPWEDDPWVWCVDFETTEAPDA